MVSRQIALVHSQNSSLPHPIHVEQGYHELKVMINETLRKKNEKILETSNIPSANILRIMEIPF